ncbi:MAG: phospho-N-acetylmuramoyl-pentapeptide-transferase [Bacilli bacterium]
MIETQHIIISMLLSFVLSLVLGHFLINELKTLKFGQTVRDDGPQSHLAKNGIPTMGGIMFIFSTIITIVLIGFVWKIQYSYYIGIVLVIFIGFAIIGFLDDFLNIKRKTSKGLSAKEKLILQFLIAGIVYFLYSKLDLNYQNKVVINTLNIEIDLGRFYVVYILVMIVGFSNAVNITDGLDGLSSGLSVIAFIVFGLIAGRMSMYVDGLNDLAIFCFSLVGGLLGFMFYNVHPAKVFMGDTGSLALGAALAIVAILTNHDVTLFIVGGVFIIEILSVVLQVISYKTTKRRVFLMSPLHHHFELLGWTEQQIVRMFWVLGLLLGLLGLWFGVLL